VLDAAGCTCPTGNLWGRKGGVYDELGERYDVPVWCVARPMRVADDTAREADGAARQERGSMREGAGEDGKDEDNGAGGVVLLSKESKGKAKAVEHTITGREISVKARLSHSARDVVIRIGDEDSVGVLVQRVRDAAEVRFVTVIHITIDANRLTASTSHTHSNRLSWQAP
jgi:hypothetical protein